MIAIFLSAVLVGGRLLAPAPPVVWNATASYKLGKIHLYARRFELARRSAEQAIRIAPDIAQNHILLGEAALELHDYDTAYRSWLQANKLAPVDPQPAYYLGRLFYEANLFNEAAAWFRETLRIAPGHFAAMTYLGLSGEGLSLPDTAGRLYRGAMMESKKQGKPYSWAWLSLAKLQRMRGDEVGAAATLEEGASLCPHPQLLTLFGQVLADSGKAERSESILRRVIQEDPSIAAAHYALARLLRKRGLLEESKLETEAFLLAKEQEPRSPVIAIQSSLPTSDTARATSSLSK